MITRNRILLEVALLAIVLLLPEILVPRYVEAEKRAWVANEIIYLHANELIFCQKDCIANQDSQWLRGVSERTGLSKETLARAWVGYNLEWRAMIMRTCGCTPVPIDWDASLTNRQREFENLFAALPTGQVIRYTEETGTLEAARQRLWEYARAK